jgi:hypothetical protein
VSSRLQFHASIEHRKVRVGARTLRVVLRALALSLAVLSCGGCAHVQPSERERLASPAMRFEMDPASEGQRDSIHEITEGGTFPSAGPGNAGAGCGCN